MSIVTRKRTSVTCTTLSRDTKKSSTLRGRGRESEECGRGPEENIFFCSFLLFLFFYCPDNCRSWTRVQLFAFEDGDYNMRLYKIDFPCALRAAIHSEDNYEKKPNTFNNWVNSRSSPAQLAVECAPYFSCLLADIFFYCVVLSLWPFRVIARKSCSHRSFFGCLIKMSLSKIRLKVEKIRRFGRLVGVPVSKKGNQATAPLEAPAWWRADWGTRPDEAEVRPPWAFVDRPSASTRRPQPPPPAQAAP